MAPETDERVAEIVELMLQGAWRSGHSHRALIAKHGVSLSVVERWAAEAGRYIRFCRGSEEDVRTRILARVEQIGTDALLDEKPDRKSALQALELEAKLHRLIGPRAPEQSQETTTVGIDEAIKAFEAAGYEVKKRGESK